MSSGTINIAGLTPVEDPAYRYKMPKMIGKVEGRGNGIKTVLANVNEVAASLTREPAEITKFFGTELGSQTTFAADRAVVNGAHRDQDLQSHLSKYIEHFVLCKNCRLPETHYKIKDGLISQKCLACGSKDAVDMTHKLTTFILASHKKAKEASKAEAKKDAKESKADKKKDKSERGDENEGKDKEKKEKKKKDKHKEKGGDDNSDEGAAAEGAEGEDGSGEKKKSHKKKHKADSQQQQEGGDAPENVFGISRGGSEKESDEDDEESDSKAAEEGMERLKLFLSNNPDASVTQICDELRNIQTMASLRPADRIIIFLGALFTENMIANKEVEKHALVLRALAASTIQQRHLIAAFEWLCGTKYPNKVKFFPVLLKSLFEEELVEEDTFLAWAGDFTRNEYSAEQSMVCLDTLEQLKGAAQPFITWLQEAEEDDSEEEGDGSEYD